MSNWEKLAGRFIVMDGPDGAGKSTQIAMLAEHLRGQGVSVVQTRDPGGTAIGDRIRTILLDRVHAEMDFRCELMLYMASRAQLVAEVIRPALARGQCVLCDRYISSTIAYQGAGGASVEQIKAAAAVAVGGLWPDLTLLLDLPPEVGMTRLKGAPDRVEAKGLEYHRAVRALFLQQAAEDPGRFAVVDAAGSVEQVQQRLQAALRKGPWNR